MTHEEKALSYFQDKFHCSQSVLAAYAEELGLTEEQALKMALIYAMTFWVVIYQLLKAFSMRWSIIVLLKSVLKWWLLL